MADNEFAKLWAPERIHDEPDSIRVDDEFHDISVLKDTPKRMSYKQFEKFVSAGTDIKPDFSMFITPFNTEEAQNKIMREIGEIRAEGGSNTKETRTDKLRVKLQMLRELKDLIVSEELRLFNFGLVLDNRAETKQEASEKKATTRESFGNFKWADMTYKMKNAFKALLPLGSNYTGHSIPMHTENLVGFFPFLENFSLEEGGIYLGRELHSGHPYAVNVWNKTSYGRMIFGKKGYGKSFLTKLMVLREKLQRPNLPVMIVDPVENPEGGGEYADLVKLLKGEIIELSAHGTETVINPLDPTLSKDLDEAVDHAVDLFGTLFDMSSEEKSLFNTTLSRIYRRNTSYDKDGELIVEEEPTISHLADELEDISQGNSRGAVNNSGENTVFNKRSEVAETLRLKLRPYVSGAYSILNQKTNVELESDVVSFDVSKVPDSHKPFFMTLVLKYIWKETVKTRTPKMIIADEAEVLMQLKMTAEFLEKYIRIIRRYHASTVLITQSALDFMGSEHGEPIMRNMMMHILMYHDHINEDMKDFYSLNQHEVSTITTPEVGRAFIKIGEQRKFVHIDATSAEHEVITTDPQEVRKKLEKGEEIEGDEEEGVDEEEARIVEGRMERG